MVRLGEHFMRNERSRHSEWLQQRRWFIKSRQDHKQRMEAENKLDSDILAIASEVVMATQIQLQKFDVQLDEYDEAVVFALMENQTWLDEIDRRIANVDARLADLFADANFMEDGRRVFLTADRTQAYDEFGVEVGSAEYDYDLFAENLKPVDPYIEILQERGELFQAKVEALEVRERIYEFEELVGEAREETASGEMTKDRLDELSAELDNLMPPEVGMFVPDHEAPTDDLDLKSEPASPANTTADRTTNISITLPQLTQ